MKKIKIEKNSSMEFTSENTKRLHLHTPRHTLTAKVENIWYFSAVLSYGEHVMQSKANTLWRLTMTMTNLPSQSNSIEYQMIVHMHSHNVNQFHFRSFRKCVNNILKSSLHFNYIYFSKLLKLRKLISTSKQYINDSRGCNVVIILFFYFLLLFEI